MSYHDRRSGWIGATSVEYSRRPPTTDTRSTVPTRERLRRCTMTFTRGPPVPRRPRETMTERELRWICPECGGDLFNGQGLRGCLDCEWVEG